MELRLLGPMAATAAAEPIDLGVRKQRLVLAVLALEVNTPVPTEQLISLVWPHDPPGSARSMIHTYVSGLRTALLRAGVPTDSVRLAREAAGYVLHCDPRKIDAHRFRELVADARSGGDLRRADLLGTALALWRGPALADIATEDGHDRLCHGLEEGRLHAAEELAHARLRLGLHHEVLDDLLALAAEHPYRPRLTSALMIALHHSGRSAEALGIYRELQDHLIRTVGLQPPAELRDLQAAILRNDPALAPPPRAAAVPAVPRQLPADLPTFTGRTDELGRLTSVRPGGGAGAGSMPIVTISGMAGVGKTALAVHAAHRLAGRFRDGQIFVDLHGFTRGLPSISAVAALEQLLRGLGVPGRQIPAGLYARAALYRTLVADRRILLVLDNAATESQVQPLLPGRGECLVLVTSRWQLAGLDGAEPLRLDVLTPADAQALFQRATGVDGPEGVVEEIVELCGRLPLAIRLAVARLRARPAWGATHLLSRLRDRRNRLTELAVGDRSVAAAIDLSYHELPAAQRKGYRLLGLHPGPDIEVHAAAALLGMPVQDATRLLGGLLDVHLLAEPAPGRYRFHDLVQAHAASRAAEDDPEEDRRLALSRLRDHYLRVPMAEWEPP